MSEPVTAARLASVGDSVSAGGIGSHLQLVGVSVNTPAASAVLTIFGNNPSLANSKVAVVDCAGAAGTSRFLDLFRARCPGGFQAFLTGGNADVTVYYS